MKSRCHCGGVTLEVSSAPDWILQCGCSICSKLGVLWAYYPDREVRIEGETATYVCNKRVIAFHRCSICGCTTHWQTLGTDFGRMGLNARLFEDLNLSKTELRVVPGPSPDVFS